MLGKSFDNDAYCNELIKEYDFLKHKFNLNPVFKSPEFFRLRPSNFPTLRLAQLSAIYSEKNNLFHLLIEKEEPDFSDILNIGTSEYWETHFNFAKISKKRKRRISSSFFSLLMINTIIPLKFAYQRYRGCEDNEVLLRMMVEIKKEENSIIFNFGNLGMPIKNAKDTQSYLQLYNNYCIKDKCLDCAIGASLMNLKV